MIERYAKLAGASEEIGMAKGNYYILIEPVFYISRLSCDENCGYYTATEIGLMYNKNNEFKNFLSSKNLSIIFYESLRLEKAGEIGNYIFGSVGNAPSKAEVSNASFLEKGYGMTLISGKEVDSYKSGKCYQIVYRTISLENPFLDANGEARTLSEESNWYRRKSVIDKDIYTNDPILVVNLTPSAIKEIRKDNKSIDYSNLNNNTYAAFYKKYKAIFSN